MPLEKQLVTMSFQGGLDTKSDPKQVQLGKLLELENCVFGTTGALRKRPGYAQLPALPSGAATAMSAFEDELVVLDGEHARAYSYAPATQSWADVGVVDSCIVGATPIVRMGAAQQLNPDLAVGTLEALVWEDSRGGVRYAVRDPSTGALLVADGLVDAGGSKPKVLWLFASSRFLIVYWDGGANLKWKTVAASAPTVFAASGTFAADAHGSTSFDAVATTPGGSSGPILLAYLRSVAGTPGVELLTIDPSTLATTASATVDTGANAFSGGPFVVGVAGVASGTARVAVAWSTGATTRGAIYPIALGTPTAASHAMSASPMQQIGLVDMTASSWIVFAEFAAVSPSNTQIYTASINPSNATPVGSLAPFARGLGLASKPFVILGELDLLSGTPNVAFCAAFDSPLQPTYFFQRANPNSNIGTNGTDVIARALAGVGGGLRTNHTLSAAPEVPNGVVVAASTKGRFLSEGGVGFSLLGVSRLELDFGDDNRFLSAIQSRNLLVVGGFVQSYDGVSFTEQNFHLYPEGITAAAAGSDGSLGSGTYQYVVVYEWTDNRGQVQRSTTSVPVSVNVTATNHVTLTIPTLRVTKKTPNAPFPRQAISIGIYRTAANGTNFNRCSSTVAPLLNDETVDTVTFTDRASDANIASNEFLYTTGGVLDNAAPPAASLVSAFQARVVVAGLEDPNTLWYSKNRFDNTNSSTTPAEFSATLTLGVDPRGGPITALGLLDDKLVIFKKSAIFVLSGDGPNDTGAGDVFADPVLVTTDAGCVAPNSVVATPDGIMFQSAKGIYLLDRSMSASYIGAPVELYNGQPILSATLHPTANEVIFTLEGTDTALVYDYLFSQWGTWTNHECVDADIFEGAFAFVDGSGVVNVQAGQYLDAGSTPIAMAFTTPNISSAGLTGFQRAYRAFVLGTYRSPHQLTVRVAFDYNAGYDEVATISPLIGDAAYEYRVDFARQRCTAVRLRVEEVPEPSYDAGFLASAVSFEIGVMPGGGRLPQTQIVGAS